MPSRAAVPRLPHRVVAVHRRVHQAGGDAPPVGLLLLGAIALAALPHADMNGRPVFDSFWIAGRIAGVASIMPQRGLASSLAMVLGDLPAGN